MQDFEKLGAFYLGRSYDVQRKQAKNELLLYDSKDLVTHAVCVGMTGSGKTGLCIGLLEEAAIDHIPSIVIDPKGDLSNLLLTFPDLKPQDFAPWVNEDDARKKGISTDEYAADQAELWKKGLSESGQDATRIRRLREAAEFSIYTPGSDAGRPVSILKSFATPDSAILEDRESLRERITITATSLLGLLGIDADPIQSREHILISTILDNAWKQARDLDLAALIHQIQTPPVNRIGVLDLESFFPAKDRFALSMQFNNLIAAPGFEAWLEGEPLDLNGLLHNPQGKPRVCIFSISHLGDAERMFFVSLLLNQTLSWVRTQSGTTSLRAVLYMDEIFGYFPPVANPPSKEPLLTLLKQARAYGLGIVLATQNPVDLDYKGLSNTGTWFIGRLQTERDKARLLDGLSGAGAQFDRGQMERTIAGLANRVFLMNNVHESATEVFQSRWTLSYLRGPLARNQIKMLASQGPVSSAPRQTQSKPCATVLPPDIPQYYLPVRGAQPDAQLVYDPKLLGAAQIHFIDAKTKVDVTRNVMFVAPITSEAVPVRWEQAASIDFEVADLETACRDDAQYNELPAAAANAKNYSSWNRDLANWSYGNQKLELFRSPGLDETSKPDESERDFRIRLQQAAREERDRCAEQLKQSYAPKIAALQERIRRAGQAKEREAQQAKQQGLQTAISVGATLLGAFMGRKKLSMSTLGRATTAARAASRSWKEAQDVGRADETVEALNQQLADLNAQFQSEVQAQQSKIDPSTEVFEAIVIRPKKTNIAVRLVALGWAAYWRDAQGKTSPAWA